jgi:hypothetical protein
MTNFVKSCACWYNKFVTVGDSLTIVIHSKKNCWRSHVLTTVLVKGYGTIMLFLKWQGKRLPTLVAVRWPDMCVVSRKGTTTCAGAGWRPFVGEEVLKNQEETAGNIRSLNKVAAHIDSTVLKLLLSVVQAVVHKRSVKARK